jgi:penicillin-binding protein 1A
MKKAVGARPEAEFTPDPSIADNLVHLTIDLKTGNIAPKNAKNSEEMWFKKGTEPTEQQPEKGQVDTSSFMGVP